MANKAKFYAAYENGKLSWIIKETGTKRITRTGYHIFSTSQRLSAEEFENIRSRYNVLLLDESTNVGQIVIATIIKTLAERVEYYKGTHYAHIVGVKRQDRDIKYLNKLITTL